MVNILGLFPLTGNGGIASWTKKFLSTFPDDEYKIYPVSSSPKARTGKEGVLERSLSGFTALNRILKEVEQTIKKQCHHCLCEEISRECNVYHIYEL